MFEEEYEKLSHGEQAQFKKVINNLLYRCYIVRRAYDRATLMNKISPDYLFVERHFEMMADYLSYMDMDLVKDDENGVCYLTSEDDLNKIRIDGVTTLILYALRSYYEDKIKANPTSNEIYIDSVAFKLLLKDLGLTTANRRISASSIAYSLRQLGMYNVITIAKGSFGESSYAFYILPSIRYVISNAKLNALYGYLNQVNGNVDSAQDDIFAEQGSGDDSSSSTGGNE